MLKIKTIKIRNFRSILSLDLNVDRMNVFVGLNDAGKSNVLKALNLFFNSETEPGVKYDFHTDYSKYAIVRKKRAKEIEITIVFEIPRHYKDHDDVKWTKKWREEGLFEDSSKSFGFSSHSKTPTLLKRVKFKYVPAVKSENYFKELLADLYVSIAREANEGLNTKADEYSEALKKFTQEIGIRVERSVGISSSLIMPANQVDIFKELVFMTNDASGKNINLSSRGDGIKAIHIPAILKYISEQDNKLMSNTSVPVTYIWGYEEPENGIEMRKCFELANDFYGFSSEIQEFITTHSPAFYQLHDKEGVKVYYVSKNEMDYKSRVEIGADEYKLHGKVGILPLISPYVEEKQKELEKLGKILNSAKFVDRDTIFVEGITDKSYFEMAIKAFSPELSKRMDNNLLKIETREENGCGTGVLVDWAIAWMHLKYDSKAIVILDADEAGKEAKKRIEEEKNRLKRSNSNLYTTLLKEPDSFKSIFKTIGNSFSYTVEHLLSIEFWEMLVDDGWVEERDCDELLYTFSRVMNKDISLGNAISSCVNDKRIESTVISFFPKENKKVEILKRVKKKVDSGDVSILEGFKNTIIYLENELLK